MKKIVIRTIILFIVLNLITAGQVLAKDVVEEENQDILDLDTQTQEADVAQREAELAEKMSEKEAEVARKQVKNAEKQILNARDQLGLYKETLADLRLPKLPKITLPHLQYSGSGGVLVIPSAEMKVENLAAITEDMSVMSRIFDNKISQANLTTEQGKWFSQRYHWLVQGGGSTTEAVYLEGYGALFLMKVNMLLAAPPEAPQKEKAEEEDTDPVWAQMRREMYEPEEPGRSRTEDRPEEQYDAEKVESLKTNLIKTLKHAANIRALKPDQLVILTVIGEKNRSGATNTQSFSYGRSTGSRSRRIVQTAPEAETGSIVPTVLTICAKKSDIDAFAKGELDYEQFRKRIEIFKSYAKAGQQASPGAEEYKVAFKEHPVF
jgi:hypothetical protein